jgi:hypothetical protein
MENRIELKEDHLKNSPFVKNVHDDVYEWFVTEKVGSEYTIGKGIRFSMKQYGSEWTIMCVCRGEDIIKDVTSVGEYKKIIYEDEFEKFVQEIKQHYKV